MAYPPNYNVLIPDASAMFQKDRVIRGGSWFGLSRVDMVAFDQLLGHGYLAIPVLARRRGPERHIE